uniref:Uncharacterized protein n=1 Tax=Tanacetum cinerariifolium TaxID=118510 RepID=A0A6L2LVU3_TANCI|nr:hypothetical protein [Tanacetum cinerariifolium]
MSNINKNLQTQTSNALHNAIIEAGDKDRPLMLAPEGTSETTTEGYMENYKNVLQDVRNQLNAEAKVVYIIPTGIDYDIYSIVDACPNSQELKTVSYHKLYDILKQHHNEVNKIRAERLAHATKNSEPIFDVETLQMVQNDDDNYNVFANDREYLEQSESVNDTYPDEQGDNNITTDLLDMINNGEEADQDDDNLARERDLLASLIEKLKCEIDDSKNRKVLDDDDVDALDISSLDSRLRLLYLIKKRRLVMI